MHRFKSLSDVKELNELFTDWDAKADFLNRYWQVSKIKHDFYPNEYWQELIREVKQVLGTMPYEVGDVVEMEVAFNETTSGNPEMVIVGTLVEGPEPYFEYLVVDGVVITKTLAGFEGRFLIGGY